MTECTVSDDFIAHHRKSGEDQSLSCHLLEVAFLASTFAGKIGLPNAGELVGLLHDLGKYSSAFQNYLKSAVGYLEQDKDDDFIDPQRMKGKIRSVRVPAGSAVGGGGGAVDSLFCAEPLSHQARYRIGKIWGVKLIACQYTITTTPF
jgi:hypothetical protein